MTIRLGKAGRIMSGSRRPTRRESDSILRDVALREPRLRGAVLDDPMRAIQSPSATATDDFYSEFAVRATRSATSVWSTACRRGI
jgi:hypothetical protein